MRRMNENKRERKKEERVKSEKMKNLLKDKKTSLGK